MKKELEGKYVVVTAISSFKMKYVIPTEELQKLNEATELDQERAREWAEECVIMEEVKDFSQKHIGETVIETQISDEDTILEIFDRENDYLSEWTREKKIDYIRHWEDTYAKKQKED
jgi:hypothetical protein